MNKSLVYIADGITFSDLESGRAMPIDIYRKQIETSILKPVELLRVSAGSQQPNFSAMAALSILLLFFEHHGRYLAGHTPPSRSRAMFDFGFNRFVEYSDADLIGDHHSVPNFYHQSRCGLYHRLRLGDDILVSSYSKLPQIFNRMSIAGDSVLICPWTIKDCLEQYLELYCEQVKNNFDHEISQNFRLFFDYDIRSVLGEGLS
jgi:hypothetical protein